MRYLIVFGAGVFTALVMWMLSYTLFFREAMQIGATFGLLGVFGLAFFDVRSWWKYERKQTNE